MSVKFRVFYSLLILVLISVLHSKMTGISQEVSLEDCVSGEKGIHKKACLTRAPWKWECWLIGAVWSWGADL